MGFQFSLDAVLRVRGIQEAHEERLLQQILFEISQAQEALAQTEAAITGADPSRSADLSNPVLGRSLHAAYGEMRQLKETRKALQAKIAQLHELREKQVMAYQVARRNREMLSNMHDEKRSAYDGEVARAEQKTLDDIYTSRRVRI